MTFDKVFPLLYDSSAYASLPPAVYVDLLSGVNPDVRHNYSGNNHMGWVGLGRIGSMTSYTMEVKFSNSTRLLFLFIRVPVFLERIMYMYSQFLTS